MATRTWKIGEYCAGGIITAQTTAKSVTLIQKEWDYSKGSRRSSDQSGARELDRITVPVDSNNSPRALSDWLHNITTSYYADQVMQWVRTKVDLVSHSYFNHY